MDLPAIQQAIQELPKDQQMELAAWINQIDLALWDEQIERDFSPGGTGMKLLEEVDAEIEAGNFRPLTQRS